MGHVGPADRRRLICKVAISRVSAKKLWSMTIEDLNRDAIGSLMAHRIPGE